MAQEMGFKAALLTSPLKCLKQLDPSPYLVNVGLALKELTGEAGPLLPNFNTLPEPYQPKPVSLTRILAVPAAGLAIAAGYPAGDDGTKCRGAHQRVTEPAEYD